MKTLILARSDQTRLAGELKDQDRSLAVTGVEQTYKAANLAHWTSCPVSAALHTAMIFSKIFHTTSLPHIEERLHTSSIYQLESMVPESDPDFENVILFGYNMFIKDFVNAFSNLYVEKHIHIQCDRIHV